MSSNDGVKPNTHETDQLDCIHWNKYKGVVFANDGEFALRTRYVNNMHHLFRLDSLCQYKWLAGCLIELTQSILNNMA